MNEPIYSLVEPWSLVTSLAWGTFSAVVARRLATVEPLPLPTGGTRGSHRGIALESPLFRALDPLLRIAGALLRDWLARIHTAPFVSRQFGPSIKRATHRLEEFQRRQLVWAGQPFGLDQNEALALSLVLGILGALAAMLIGESTETRVWVLPSAIIGAALLNIRLQSLSAARFTEMSRELPASIDLIALAMNAGCDFPGAIRRVIHGQTGVVADELAQVLHSLDLGITRGAALLALRDRVPVQEVRDLVRALLLAEKKGASITEALSYQASASRTRRSVRAEEAAARAGVLLLVPLMLLMACILILLFAPLLSSGIGL